MLSHLISFWTPLGQSKAQLAEGSTATERQWGLSQSSGNDEKSTHTTSVAAAFVRATHAKASKLNPMLRNPSTSEPLANISTHVIEVFSYCWSFIRVKNAATPGLDSTVQSLAWIWWAKLTTQNTQRSPHYASPSREYNCFGPGCTASGSSQAQCLRY